MQPNNIYSPKEPLQEPPRQKALPRKEKPVQYLLRWQAKKFEDLDRHPYWHLIVFVSLLVLLSIAIFNNNYLFGLIIVLSGFLIYIFERMNPRIYYFGITEKGIMADNYLYKFSALKSFWIFYESEKDGRKELSLERTGYFLTHVHIPLGETPPDKIREILLQFISEEKHTESIIDRLEKFL